MVTRNDSLWKTLDWVTIFIYLLLIVGGWFSVCGASYDYGERDFLDFSTRAGKQFVWIICSFGLGFVLLMLEKTVCMICSRTLYMGDDSLAHCYHLHSTGHQRITLVACHGDL